MVPQRERPHFHKWNQCPLECNNCSSNAFLYRQVACLDGTKFYTQRILPYLLTPSMQLLLPHSHMYSVNKSLWSPHLFLATKMKIRFSYTYFLSNSILVPTRIGLPQNYLCLIYSKMNQKCNVTRYMVETLFKERNKITQYIILKNILILIDEVFYKSFRNFEHWSNLQLRSWQELWIPLNVWLKICLTN